MYLKNSCRDYSMFTYIFSGNLSELLQLQLTLLSPVIFPSCAGMAAGDGIGFAVVGERRRKQWSGSTCMVTHHTLYPRGAPRDMVVLRLTCVWIHWG